jgi:hypothetical protein
LEKHHVSNDATENAWLLSNLICLPGNGPLWYPFLAVRGLKEGEGPRPGALHSLQHGRLPSSGTGGGGTPVPFRAPTSNRSYEAEEKSYWRCKIAERCQLRRRTATVRLLCDTLL